MKSHKKHVSWLWSNVLKALLLNLLPEFSYEFVGMDCNAGEHCNPRGGEPTCRKKCRSIPFLPTSTLGNWAGFLHPALILSLVCCVPGHQSLPQPLTLPHESGKQGDHGTEHGQLGNPHHRIPESQGDALDEPPGKHDELAKDGDAADLAVQLRLQSSGAHHLCELAQHGDDGQDENDTDNPENEHN